MSIQQAIKKPNNEFYLKDNPFPEILGKDFYIQMEIDSAFFSTEMIIYGIRKMLYDRKYNVDGGYYDKYYFRKSADNFIR